MNNIDKYFQRVGKAQRRVTVVCLITLAVLIAAATLVH